MGVKGLKDACTGVGDLDDTHAENCRICALANIKRFPFPKSVSSLTRASRILYRVHTDICGPLPAGWGGFKYFTLFIDDSSRFRAVYFLKHKSEISKVFDEFRLAAEKYHGVPVVFLHCDNAQEYIHGLLEDYCKLKGISYEKIVPDASQQNGVAERGNWSACAIMRAMLIEADMPDWFWPFAILSAVHILNRLPSKSITPGTTPYEGWSGRKADLSHLRPWGCHVTARKVNSDSLPKTQPRGVSGRFIGYPRDSKGYFIWIPATKSILVRRDVVFHDMPQIPATPVVRTGPLWEDFVTDSSSQLGSCVDRSVDELVCDTSH